MEKQKLQLQTKGATMGEVVAIIIITLVIILKVIRQIQRIKEKQK